MLYHTQFYKVFYKVLFSVLSMQNWQLSQIDCTYFHFYTGWHSLVTWRLQLLQGLRSPTWILTSSGLAPQPNTRLTSAATRTWSPTGFPQMNNAIFRQHNCNCRSTCELLPELWTAFLWRTISRLRFLSCYPLLFIGTQQSIRKNRKTSSCSSYRGLWFIQYSKIIPVKSMLC